MSKEEKKFKLDNGPLVEPKIPAPKADGKIHVDLYLKSTSVPMWERGGKKAFAQTKGKEFATDNEFKELFSAY